LLSLLEVGSNGYGELTVMVGPPSARDLETGCVVSGGVGAFGEADAVPARGPVRSGPVRSQRWKGWGEQAADLVRPDGSSGVVHGKAYSWCHVLNCVAPKYVAPWTT